MKITREEAEKFFKSEKWHYWWEEWIKPIIIAVVLALFIRTFIIQPFKIPSNSMYPTLKPGDRIFVSKFIYGAKIPLTPFRLPEVRKPKIGDIVVFLSPVEKKKFLVKRFIATGGDVIAIRDGHLYLNNREVEIGPVKNVYYYNRGDYGTKEEGVKVPEGYFFVLGDNSANSLDSRYWGFIPYDRLVGKAFVIHWPIKRIRLLGDNT
ncbi:MAG: signal peptidase I [Candidatus Omnitrophica bacterium]|nr:signal peptidase I [Candidatus Omnitrophota bacterium]